MNLRRTFRRLAAALLLSGLVLSQETLALAGTTGSLSGTVADTAGKPIAGVAVKVTSASQVSSTTTDAGGHFVFLSLQPDTYTLSLDKADYEPVAEAGISIFADQQQTLVFTMHPALKQIAHVTSTAAGALVRAGTTSDVYSVNSTTAAAVTGLGGGGGLDNAYSAIATMPGAYVPVGQAGWYQSVYIRGGDYDQVGYEVDGVPVNRAFDNYPSNTASSLGQQELQVYTGAAPADAQGQGIAGFINQVIKTGTYPGFANSDIALGFPSFYHKLNVEVGGASENRLFSYYVGLGGYDLSQRAYDQFNGASVTNQYGAILGACPAGTGDPACYAGGTFLSGSPGGVQTPGFILAPFYTDDINSDITDREAVVNLHFGIPHKHDGGRDDIQVLYDTSQIAQYYANSQNDYAYGLSQLGITTPLPYLTGNLYTGGLNQPINLSTVGNNIINYAFPGQNGSPTIPLGTNDSTSIGDAIIKLQYQKNFSSSAYMRLYGYTDYGNWFNNGPLSMAYTFEEGLPQFDQLPDYVVSSHERGVSGIFADQLSNSNLLQFQTSFTTGSSERSNSYTSFESPYQQLGTLVSTGAPDSGICYGYSATGVLGPTGCSTQQGYNPSYFSVGTATAACAGAPTATVNNCNPGVAPAGYEYLATENGYNGEYNDVTPRFWSGSLVDTFDPTDRLHLNVGVRFDDYAFIPNGTQTPASNFWFNSWNNEMCYNKAAPGSNLVALPTVTPAENASNGGCAAELNPTITGSNFIQAYLSNNVAASSFPVWQPRVGLTYTLTPRDVLRASYGRYDQEPDSAFEEYDTFQQDLPDYLGPTFFAYGRTSPTYPIAPEVSDNWDLSWEHQFKGTDVSMKVTPFYRTTQDQIEEFYLNVTAGFVSGLNIGSQTNRGVEFDLQKGDFSRNGFSGMLAFTYTNAYVNYAKLSTGNSVLTTVNDGIQTFNAYTSACANGTAKKSLCGSTASGVAAAPCYTTAGAPVATSTACTAADVANPYWNMAPQGLFSASGSYWPYDLFPAGPGAGSYSSFVTPYVATIVVNYKHDKFTITPALQFSAGNRYGYPLAEAGYDPSTCTGVTGVPIGSAWYATAGGSGNAANPSTCSSTIDIPNTATGKFDGIGAFVNPAQFTLATQISYQISPKITAVLTMSNIVAACLGGSSEPWTQNLVALPGYKVCGYGTTSETENGYPPGNVNAISSTGAQVAQPENAYAYTPDYYSLPFNAYLDFRVKL